MNDSYKNSVILCIYITKSNLDVKRTVAKSFIRRGFVKVNDVVITNIRHLVKIGDKVKVLDKLIVPKY